MEHLRNSDIKYLKGVGPTRADLLSRQLGIHSLFDLLYHFPANYVDRSHTYNISEFSGEMPAVQVKGRFVTFNILGEGAKTRLVGLFSDGQGLMEVVWFNRIKTIKEAYHTGVDYILFGKPNYFHNGWSMAHPEIETFKENVKPEGLRGVYPLTDILRNKGITSRTLHDLVLTALTSKYAKDLSDPLPLKIISDYRLMPLKEALTAIHNPKNNEELQSARFRLKFEELFYLQINIQSFCRKRTAMSRGQRFPRIGKFFNDFYSRCLPFELTGAQKRVIKEIRADMATGRQMNRLLQGDVGSGKTLVALLTMLIAIDNSTQAALLAPTEILANQHFESLNNLVAPIGINIKLLTGSTRKKERELISQQLEDGTLHILVGTHAVIEDKIKFRNLGFVVIDEQHRFGVAQRAKMWKKNIVAPHVLVMTATPIPRTLAMTLYGDLDVSVIDELPPGRKPVKTLLRYDEERYNVYRALGAQLRQGRQAYIVYPLIKENEKVDLKSLEEGYEQICEIFRDFKVAFVHGQMKPQQKDYQMGLFVTHKADILVATTVIEVGVNVPNATIMIIENAERFGLSQLHQLRGRVGRGGEQSYCILMSKEKIARETRKRLEIMTSTSDGFVVAEADLKLRGPGDLEGTLQSGMGFHMNIANLSTDGQILQMAKRAASDLLDSDPTLRNYPLLVKEMRSRFERTVDWGMIS